VSEYLCIDEAAVRAGVSRRTIYNWLKAGKLAVANTPSGRTRIDASCLLVSQNTHQKVVEQPKELC
jgi:excisionase family DNA binding protein